MMLFSWMFSVAALASPPPAPADAWGVGVLLQGARPGLLVEHSFWLSSRVKARGRRSSLALVPMVSGWVHPGHQIPLQAHLHLESRTQRGRWFSTGGFGLGPTWVINARRTVQLDDTGQVRTVPLASQAVVAPSASFGFGRQGARSELAARGRLALWVPWQHWFALSWNVEVVARFGRGAG